jgi:hypothetical protein
VFPPRRHSKNISKSISCRIIIPSSLLSGFLQALHHACCGFMLQTPSLEIRRYMQAYSALLCMLRHRSILSLRLLGLQGARSSATTCEDSAGRTLHTPLENVRRHAKVFDATVIYRHASSMQTPALNATCMECTSPSSARYQLRAALYLCPITCDANECGVHSFGRTGETASLPSCLKFMVLRDMNYGSEGRCWAAFKEAARGMIKE